MYAIIKDGGHQYRVESGRRISVQRREVEKGATITFDQVCLVGGEGGPKVGRPFVQGATVEGKVVTPELKAKKVVVLKYRRRKNSVRRNCHRQKFTVVEITAIKA